MKAHSVTNSRTMIATFGGIALAIGLFAFRADASEWDKRTIVTVSQPLQVRETLLQPGTYVFQLLDSSSERHVVQIFNGDQSHIINTVLAIPTERMEVTGETQFTFWETPGGYAKALRKWYYPGDTIGQEFPYPKHPAMLEASAAPAPTLTSEPPAPTPQPTAEPTPIPEPKTEAKAEAVEKPVEVDQTPAPTPTPSQPPAAEPQPPPAPQEPAALPKTASPYPLIGLSGLLALSLYGLLRWKRPA